MRISPFARDLWFSEIELRQRLRRKSLDHEDRSENFDYQFHRNA